MNIDPKKTISLTEARKNIFDIAKDVQKPGSHYVFTEKGRPKAVMMSADEFDSWEETLDVIRSYPDIFDDIAQAEKEFKEGKTIPLEDVMAELGLVVSDDGKNVYVADSTSHKSKKKSS